MTIKAMPAPATFEQLVESAPVLCYAVDRRLRYTYINPFFATVHDIAPQAAVGKHIADVIGQSGFDNNAGHYARVLGGHRVAYESSFDKANGEPHHYRAIYTPLSVDGEVTGFTGVVLDVTAQKLMEALSNTDPLTRISNRRKFEASLQALLRQDSSAAFSLLLMDIDDFKDINDHQGHAKGDEVLVALGQLLVAEVRDLDSVYRIGGEEFVVLLRDLSDRSALERRADAIRRAVEAGRLRDERRLTVSIGARIVRGGQDMKQVMADVDQALYRAKQTGKNTVCLAAESADAPLPGTRLPD